VCVCVSLPLPCYIHELESLYRGCICMYRGCICMYISYRVSYRGYICMYVSYVFMCVCVCVCVYTHTHTYTHVYVYVYMYMYVCVCVCVCIHIYVYSYGHFAARNGHSLQFRASYFTYFTYFTRNGNKFSKVRCIVTRNSEYSRALTFENVCVFSPSCVFI